MCNVPGFSTNFPCNLPSCEVFFLSSLSFLTIPPLSLLLIHILQCSTHRIFLTFFQVVMQSSHFSVPLTISSLLSFRWSCNPLISVFHSPYLPYFLSGSHAILSFQCSTHHIFLTFFQVVMQSSHFSVPLTVNLPYFLSGSHAILSFQCSTHRKSSLLSFR